MKRGSCLGMKSESCLGNEMCEVLEAGFCQARAALNPSGKPQLLFPYHAAYRGRMPRNKNSTTSNSNQFELLVIEEGGADDNTGGGTSAASDPLQRARVETHAAIRPRVSPHNLRYRLCFM